MIISIIFFSESAALIDLCAVFCTHFKDALHFTLDKWMNFVWSTFKFILKTALDFGPTKNAFLNHSSCAERSPIATGWIPYLLYKKWFIKRI